MSVNTHIGTEPGLGKHANARSHDLDFKSLWVGLKRHRILIILLSAVMTAISFYYVMNTTPTYRATASLLIETQNSNVVSIDDLYGVDTQDSEYYQTQIEILRSRKLARRVIDSLNLWDHPELSGRPVSQAPQQTNIVYKAIHSVVIISSRLLRGSWARIKSMISGGGDSLPTGKENTPGSVSSAVDSAKVSTLEPATDSLSDAADAARNTRRNRIVERLMSRIVIVPVRKTKFVRIQYESADPMLASRVANAVGLQFIASFLDSKETATQKASSWLEAQLKLLKTRLADSEQRMLDYKKANGLVDFKGNVGRLNEQELLLVSRDLADARKNLAEAKDVLAKAQSIKSLAGALDTLSVFQNDKVISRLTVDIGLVNQKLDELANRYGERHPLIVDANSKLSALEALRQDNVARVLGSLEQNVSLAAARVSAFEIDLGSARRDIEDIATKAIELEALESEVATNQKLYNTFFVRITETRSASGLEEANASIADYAVPPSGPFKPKKTLVVGGTALCSLLFSILLSLLLERFNRTIRGSSDVEYGIGVKLLGITPTVKRSWFSSKKLLPISPLTEMGKDVEFLEAIDSIRAELFSTGLLEDSKVILITSSEPNEGKSTVAINLAHSLAQQESVLLIDCDLRRPSIASALQLDESKPGLTNLVQDLKGMSDVLVRDVANSNLHVIPAGRMPQRPLRTLMSDNLAELLRIARLHYDRIIIDTPPVHAVSDALVISKLVDTCIYVAASHRTSIAQAKRGLARLNHADAKVAGVVVSQVDVKKLSKYGGEQYFQGYLDMYGYTSVPKVEREAYAAKPGSGA